MSDFITECTYSNWHKQPLQAVLEVYVFPHSVIFMVKPYIENSWADFAKIASKLTELLYLHNFYVYCILTHIYYLNIFFYLHATSFPFARISWQSISYHTTSAVALFMEEIQWRNGVWIAKYLKITVLHKRTRRMPDSQSAGKWSTNLDVSLTWVYTPKKLSPISIFTTLHTSDP